MYTYTKTITVAITPKKFKKLKKIYEYLTGVEEEEFDKTTFECWLEDFMFDFQSDKEFFEDFEEADINIDYKLKERLTKDE